MNRVLGLGLVAVLALAGCSSGASLAGDWTPASAELGGRDFPVANFLGGRLRLTANTYEFAGDKGTYAVLAAGRPASMDIRGQEGPNAGRTIQAIYEISGDQLTICYQLGTGERPAEFKSPAGSQVLLIHYRRVK